MHSRLLLPRVSRILVAILLAGLATGAAPAGAAVRRVPLDHATIAAGITAAAPGDTILVAPGTYSTSGSGEVFPLDVTTAGVTLLGAGMGVSVLDAEGQGSVVRLRAANARLEGFTVTGGLAVRGGGVFLGVGATGAAEVTRCLVLENGASDRGSGIFADNGIAPWIHHNVVWLSFDPDVAGGGDPHGVELFNAGGVIEHNLIGRGDSNGLLNTGTGSSPTVRNNIFYRNGIPAVRGRGFCALGNVATTIRNNLFFENTIAAVIMRINGTPTDVSGTVANGIDLNDAVDGNLDLDPAFLDEGGLDFHLTAGSAAIDAGWPGSPLDPDGTPADLGPLYFDQALVGVPALPGAVILALRAAPNPSRTGTTVLRIQLAHPADDVTIAIHDARGRQVALLASGPRAAGAFDVRWAADRVAAGVYFARARVDGAAAGARIVIVE